jgi:4-hydroxybenzoate polyprenyltransferase
MALLPLLRATHLGPSLAVTAMATGLAAASGVRGGRLVVVALAVLAGQFSVGWGNDWVDADRDRRAGREDKPIAAGEVAKRTVARCAIAALVVCAAVSLLLGVQPAAAHLLAVGLGWSYDIGVKRTVLSPLPYALAFGLLPVVVALVVGGTAPAWVVGAAALLGAGAHFLNTLPDVERDAATGVRGLPQRLGPQASAALGAGLLGAGGLLAGAGLGGIRALVVWQLVLLGLGALLVLAAFVVGLARRTRAAFTLSMGAAGTLVALLAGAGPLLG